MKGKKSKPRKDHNKDKKKLHKKDKKNKNNLIVETVQSQPKEKPEERIGELSGSFTSSSEAEEAIEVGKENEIQKQNIQRMIEQEIYERKALEERKRANRARTWKLIRRILTLLIFVVAVIMLNKYTPVFTWVQKMFSDIFSLFNN